MPLSSDAFNSKTHSLIASPNIYLAKHNTLLVFPIPGGPTRIMFGRFPILAMALNLSTMSALPWTSSKVLGRYLHNALSIILFKPD